MSEYIAQKEKEKQEKAAAKAAHKKSTTTAQVEGPKNVRLPNSKREKNSFYFEDHSLTTALKESNLNDEAQAEARATLDEAPKRQSDAQYLEPTSPVDGTNASSGIRREVTVGLERFQAASGNILERIADSVFRTEVCHSYG
jgi:actin-related protein 9